MDTFEDKVLRAVDSCASLLRWATPSKEHHTTGTLLCDKVNDLLREALPAFAGMAVGLVCSHSQACV